MHSPGQTKLARSLQRRAAKRMKKLNAKVGRKAVLLRHMVLLKNYKSDPPRYGGKPLVSSGVLRQMFYRC